MEMIFPVAELFQVFGDMFGKQDVLGIAAIHHPLGDVDAGAGDVRPSTDIDHPADRAAMYAHAQLQLGMPLVARLISRAHSTGASGRV